jgi:DNA-binding ferritin-like protein (Dps family)
MGKEFSDMANKNFDLKNPWDQGVLVAIFTNMLACVVVNAELTGDDIREFVKNFYNDHLEEYRQEANRQIVKLNRKY